MNEIYGIKALNEEQFTTALNKIFEIIISPEVDENERRIASYTLPWIAQYFHDTKKMAAQFGDLKEEALIWAERAENLLKNVNFTEKVINLLAIKPARYSAIKTLGPLSDKQAIKPLLELLYTEPQDVQYTIIQNLLEYFRSDEVIEELFKAIKSDNADLRATTIESLYRIDDPRTIPALKNAIKDPDNFVRIRATYALIQIQTTEALDILFSAIEYDDEVMNAALGNLYLFNDSRTTELIEKLINNQRPFYTNMLVDDLAAINTENTFNILLQCARNQKNYELCKDALSKLAPMDHPAIDEIIIELSTSEDEMLQSSAINAIKHRRGAEFENIILNTLKSDNSYCHWSALENAPEFPSWNMIQTLNNFIEQSDDKFARKTAEIQLQKIKLQPILQTIIEDFKSNNNNRQITAIKKLSQLRKEEKFYNTKESQQEEKVLKELYQAMETSRNEDFLFHTALFLSERNALYDSDKVLNSILRYLQFGTKKRNLIISLLLNFKDRENVKWTLLNILKNEEEPAWEIAAQTFADIVNRYETPEIIQLLLNEYVQQNIITQNIADKISVYFQKTTSFNTIMQSLQSSDQVLRSSSLNKLPTIRDKNLLLATLTGLKSGDNKTRETAKHNLAYLSTLHL